MERAEVRGSRDASAGNVNMLAVIYMEMRKFTLRYDVLKRFELSDRLPHPLVHVTAKTARATDELSAESGCEFESRHALTTSPFLHRHAAPSV